MLRLRPRLRPVSQVPTGPLLSNGMTFSLKLNGSLNHACFCLAVPLALITSFLSRISVVPIRKAQGLSLPLFPPDDLQNSARILLLQFFPPLSHRKTHRFSNSLSSDPF